MIEVIERQIATSFPLERATNLKTSKELYCKEVETLLQ